MKRLGLVALAVLALFVYRAWPASSATPCGTVALADNVASVVCGPTSASWSVQTSPPPTSTTTVTVAPSTAPATTTTGATTTTSAPAQLTCTAFGAPTNTFTLNDALGSPGQINTSTPLFTLQADGALSSYTLKIDDTVLAGTFRNYTSSTVCIKAAPLTDGTHTISAVELAPTAQQVAPYSFIVDTTPPPVATITAATFASGYVRMSGTGIATFHISAREVGAPGTGGAWVGSTGLWSVAYSRPSGPHTLYVVQADKAGNESGPSNTVGVVVP